MPPKQESNKKGGQQLQVLAQLTAVQNTFKAACRRYGVPLDKELAAQIAEAIQEGGTISKVSLTGPGTTSGTVRAALDFMAGYPCVKNLACWGCSIGSEGVQAIAGLIRASGDKWWTGSRLRLLEVVGDGGGKALSSWPATCMAHMSGSLAVQGTGHEQPNLLLDTQAAQVTQTTFQLQQAGFQSPSLQQLEEEFATTVRIGRPITTTTYQVLAEARQQHHLAEAQKQAAGVLDHPPVAGYTGKPVSSTLQPGQLTAHQQLQNESAESMGERLKRLASMAATPAACGAAQAPTALEGILEASAETEAAAGGSNAGVEDEQSVTLSVSAIHQARQESMHDGSEGGARTPSSTRASIKPIVTFSPSVSGKSNHNMQQNHGETIPTHSSNVAVVPHPNLQPAADCTALRVRPSCGQAAAGDRFLTGPADLRPMTFSKESLHQLSLALSAVAHGLQVLVLDHNHLGDLGMHVLAYGLKRCSSLTHLSLSDCGLGPVSGHALASVMVPDPDPLVAARQPKLLQLNLSRNPIGGQGLTALCEGLAACPSLKALNLSGCDLTEDSLPALAQLANTLAVNTSIDNIDLEANFFGDVGVSVFFPFLSTTTHVRKFRVSARALSGGIGAQLTQLVRKNLPKKAVMKKKSDKKK